MVPRISSNTVLGLGIPLLMRGPWFPNIERSIGRASRCLSRHFTYLFVIGKRLPNRSYLDNLSITVLKVSGECSVSAAYCKGPPGRDNPNLVSANWLGLADTEAVLVRKSSGNGSIDLTYPKARYHEQGTPYSWVKRPSSRPKASLW